MTEHVDFNGSFECNVVESHLDKLPEPDTLYIFMTRGERKIRNEVNKYFGNIRFVVVDVDGERHKYDADALIALLEALEVTANADE